MVNRNINKLKILGSKINIQKSILFLFTNNETYKKEIMKTILISIASKIIKCLFIMEEKNNCKLNITKHG